MMLRTGKSLGLAVAAAALLGGAAQAAALGVDQLRETINRVPMYHIITGNQSFMVASNGKTVITGSMEVPEGWWASQCRSKTS